MSGYRNEPRRGSSRSSVQLIVDLTRPRSALGPWTSVGHCGSVSSERSLSWNLSSRCLSGTAGQRAPPVEAVLRNPRSGAPRSGARVATPPRSGCASGAWDAPSRCARRSGLPRAWKQPRGPTSVRPPRGSPETNPVLQHPVRQPENNPVRQPHGAAARKEDQSAALDRIGGRERALVFGPHRDVMNRFDLHASASARDSSMIA